MNCTILVLHIVEHTAILSLNPESFSKYKVLEFEFFIHFSSSAISNITSLSNDDFPYLKVTFNFSSSSGYGDEFLWSAAWLYRATGDSYYRQDCTKWWAEFNLNYRPESASWNVKVAQAQVLLAKIDGSVQYVNAARTFCDWVVNEAPKTPKGLVFLSLWGSLRHAANVAYVCLQASNLNETYRTFAKTQIDYILGDTGRSYVVGFGNNPPLRPHHRAA